MELQLHGGETHGEHEVRDEAGDSEGVLPRGPSPHAFPRVQQSRGGRRRGRRQGGHVHLRREKVKRETAGW